MSYVFRQEEYLPLKYNKTTVMPLVVVLVSTGYGGLMSPK